MPHGSQSSNVHKCTRRLALFLVLGAALQYAVAAGFGLDGRLPSSKRLKWRTWVDESPSLTISHSSDLGRDAHGLYAEGAIDPEWTGELGWGRFEWDRRNSIWWPTGPGIPPETPSWSRLKEFTATGNLHRLPVHWSDYSLDVGCGWPFRSAAFFAIISTAKPGPWRADGWMIENAPNSRSLPRVIPLHIIWPGALANTAVYGAAILLMWRLIGSGRRAWRSRRRRCRACNYDLRATTTGVCPECGAAIQGVEPPKT